MDNKHIQHLHWRAGFGITPKQLQQYAKKSRKQIVDELFKESKTTTPLLVDTTEIEDYYPELFARNPLKRREFNKKSLEKLKAFNYAWIERLSNPYELLREKMTLFWTNHFVCKDNHIMHVQQFNNTLRAYALGDFRDFVKTISKEAVMIKYLNSKQNKKRKPNENFARELMELFTLGMDNYSEEDIKESARAFTGYNHNFNGEFVLKERQHDYEFKSFFGKRGRYDGDDIIDIILEQKQCAKFISEKIYRYFVNDKVNSKHIQEMVDVFYPNYNIEALMRFVFMSDWFYDEQNIGTKIKSPIDLLIGIQNTVPFTFENEKDVIKIQKILGQALLNPPNVAGWEGGQSWIDSNTIMVRLKLASILLSSSYISNKKKGDFNDAFKQKYYKQNKNKQPFKTQPDWNSFDKEFSDTSFKGLKTNLLSGVINSGTNEFLEDLSKLSKKEFCVQLMSLPEYQMC